MIQNSSAVDNESDDELSTGAVFAISIVVAFIITLVVTALITYIITSLYYKHLINQTRKSIINRDFGSRALTGDIKRHGRTNAYTDTNIKLETFKMEPNPAYGITSTIKMDTNPAYAITTL